MSSAAKSEKLMFRETEPLDLIISYGMDYLEASVVKETAKFSQTKDIQNLHNAQWHLAKLIEREEFKQQLQTNHEKRAGNYGKYTD